METNQQWQALPLQPGMQGVLVVMPDSIELINVPPPPSSLPEEELSEEGHDEYDSDTMMFSLGQNLGRRT